MAKLSRKFFSLFGTSGASSNFGQFGSQAVAAPVNTKDTDVIQALAAWTSGWQSAVVASNKAPYLEDMNSLCYVFAYMIATNMQDGIPAWETATTYYTGSVVRKDGTSELYASKLDSNLGNALPSQVDNGNWQYIPPGNPTGTILAYGGSAAPTGYLLCDGSAVSRTGSTLNLFNVLGTSYGVGDGSTTFNLPDLRGRTPVGVNGATFAARGTTIGAETHSHTQAAHNHTVSAHSHTISHKHVSPVCGQNPTLVASARTDGAGWPYGTSTIASSQCGEVVASGTNARTVFMNTSDSDTANSGSASPTTDSQTPTINSASSIQPSLAVNFIIKI